MADDSWRNKPQGEQRPDKYQGNVGPAYQYFGEQPGWLYYPPTDSYVQDPNYQQQWAEQMGVAPEKPKDPSFMDQYGGIIGAGTALGLASGFAKDPGGFVGGIKDAAGGLMNLGGSAPAGSASPAGVTGIGPVTDPSMYASMMNGQGAFASQGALPGVPNIVDGGAVAGAGAAPGAGATGQGLFGLTGAPSGALGAAGLAAGAYTGYQQLSGLGNALKDKDMSLQQQAALALPTFGLSFLANSFLNEGDDWKHERDKLKSLAEDGTFVPDNLLTSMPTHGRKKEELVDKNQSPDFIGFDSAGNWVNNKFANSRDVADLKAEDIVNYAAFAENDPDWFKKDMQTRLNIANSALQAGAVKEGKGSVSVDFKKFDPGTAGAYAAIPGSKTPLQNGAPTAAPAPNAAGMPGPNRDNNTRPVRVSPGVYKDPVTGKVYKSANGAPPK